MDSKYEIKHIYLSLVTDIQRTVFFMDNGGIGIPHISIKVFFSYEDKLNILIVNKNIFVPNKDIELIIFVSRNIL